MQPDKEFEIDRPVTGFPGIGLLRPTLLFGTAAIALALMIVPMLDSGESRGIGGSVAQNNPFPGNLDLTTTGSVGGGGGAYVIRRSVLQASPDSVCVIRANGRRSGDC